MFHRSSFSTTSFSTTSFRFASQEQSGRSGYWRLFFNQLQEEALKKKGFVDLEKPFKEPYKLIENADGSATVTAIVSRKRPAVVLDELPEEVLPPLPPFKPKQLTEVEPANWLAYIWKITQEQRFLILQYRADAVQLARGVSSANDDEDDVELLLLAA